ncbi:LysR family transcriptional regulator [Hyphomicrobium sp.]|jgi:LysR family cyn operon transcriptional activator|uniref:LysR family transcriptional regulator n=1 Tax=Hyphomicrobium sp. TaxID=82 RepID=UPI003568B8EC
MKNIDLALRQFIAIAGAGSVSRAADALGLTQSGLSKQLSLLEEGLGQTLFERHGRGVVLSSAGKTLHDAIKTSYELIDATVVRLREEQGITEGRLRIATIHPLSSYFITGVIAKFMAQRPNVNVSMIGRSSPDVIALVETGKVEIGFVYDEAVATANVEETILFDEKMSLVVSEDSVLANADSVDLRETQLSLVVFPAPYSQRRMLQLHGLDSHAVAEVDTLDAMLKLVSLTSGQCILPDHISGDAFAEHRLVAIPISAPLLRRRVVAIHRKGRTLSSLANLILEIARATIKSRGDVIASRSAKL